MIGGVKLDDICEVEFLKEGEFIVLSKSMVTDILHKTKLSTNNRLVIKLEEMMSIGYIRYLVNVINSNRENVMFEYKYLRKSFVSFADIPIIIGKQLEYLSVGGMKYFLKVSFEKSPKLPVYTLIVNKYVFSIVKDKNMTIKMYDNDEDE